INSRSQRADADIDKVLLSTEQLNEILDYMGRQIGHEYQDKELLVLGVLKGGFMFTTLEVDFFKASSYGTGTSSSGSVKLDESFDLSSIKGKHVLVAEDIIDTGLTMSSLVSLLRRSGAMSVRVAVLLDKRARRKVTFDPDFVGMYMGEEFVVGYGIDFAERYRWLPYIGVPKPELRTVGY
ncbi:hypoxanthine phosphoribosyltransferase, partial [Haematococcus lacustris]